jgi:hypothetical protein
VGAGGNAVAVRHRVLRGGDQDAVAAHAARHTRRDSEEQKMQDRTKYYVVIPDELNDGIGAETKLQHLAREHRRL